MDTQTFLNNLKSYADRFTAPSQISSEFIDFFESGYETYTSATPQERDNIRDFVRSPSKPKSLFGSLFQSNKESSQIAHMLLVYVKERVLPQLKSTKDAAWLYIGLAAISMDDFTGTFDDQVYTSYPMKGDASFLLADLFVTAEEAELNPVVHPRSWTEVLNKVHCSREGVQNAPKTKFQRRVQGEGCAGDHQWSQERSRNLSRA